MARDIAAGHNTLFFSSMKYTYYRDLVGSCVLLEPLLAFSSCTSAHLHSLFSFVYGSTIPVLKFANFLVASVQLGDAIIKGGVRW
jgi:hypothetical protein